MKKYKKLKRKLLFLFLGIVLFNSQIIEAQSKAEKDNFHIFILMGQSNMSGYGELFPEDKLPIEGVKMLRGWTKEGKNFTWETAKHPIHNRLPSNQFGLAGPFAKAYKKAHPGVKVGLIPVAFGGAEIATLSKGGHVYKDAINKINWAAKQGVIKGVLWHQGESDTVEPKKAKNYQKHLKQLILDLRSDLKNSNLPFIVGNLAEFYGTGPDHNAPKRVERINMVKQSLRNMPNLLPNVAFVESKGLKARQHHQVHFDRASLITFGKRYAAAYEALLLPKEPSRVEKEDWLLNASSYKANVYQGERSDELVLSNGLLRRTFRIVPNAATVGFDNLANGESLLRGVKPEAIVKINGVTYEVGGLKGQPNYAFLKKEWIDKLKTSPSAMQYLGYEVSEPKAPFKWKQVRYYAKGAEWPPKGIHLRMDYSMPEPTSVLKGNGLLPSDYGRKNLYKTDFKSLGTSWKTVYSNSHERSSFENEGKVGEIYTPQNTAVYVEKAFNTSAKIIEASFDVGTDKSTDYGPGIALAWPNKTLKFYLRPGGDSPMFGLWDGQKEYKISAKNQEIDMSKTWTLRFRITNDIVFCEAMPKGGEWIVVQTLKPFNASPNLVRIGKTNAKGQGVDAKNAKGELVRLHVKNYASYGSIDVNAQGMQKHKAKVSVHYELYDGLPVMAKWITVENQGAKPIIIDDFTSEIIALVEYGSAVDAKKYNVPKPNIHVETDYAFGSFNVDDANHHAVHWESDPEYLTQVNYLRKTPCLLKVSPEIGPSKSVNSGETFKSFRTFVLPYDSYDRERQGLALKKLYRTLAPWSSENPLMMHARFADWERVKTAIDQAAEVGFEMVILTFGSGFNIEDDSEEYINKMKQYANYAKSKGIEIGGYSLLASRRIGNGQDVVMPKGQRPTFGNAPCLGSEWGQNYFKKLYAFYEKTGFTLLEHDGSYPGDVCMSQDHPGHKGLEDSRWEQYQTISKFYQWCRENGIYLNIPDFYYMTGGNKCGMGYREVNWSLPRNQQLLHTRQNIFDGSWEKTPSMGWMFVPLTEYHGGGAAATIEPLNEHLSHYEMMMTSNLGGGVQACYRGPRLFDSNKTKNMVSRVVTWYKLHREVLEGDIIHLRRADGRDLDYWLNVNPKGVEKGMLMVYNPTNKEISKTIKVPLYYTGLKDKAKVQIEDGKVKTMDLNRDYSIELEVKVKANSYSWAVIK
ncbi:hypothetical protein JL193_03905 [Polaribacter batillariae]|uniref:Sialate O-acetylesterase domain-containing protein n=1 Tax=Polaribacter batillariae TaxID=2808900 RepID=A0ABX7SW34_9FLAO|nr:sialate O-acetylesterase [Polaribacter batillariae]QTD38447.1 hypothetical protein JL193_03905 [Polaribacter batillariae]